MLWSIDFWKPTIIFNFRDFLIEYNPVAKTTYTRFPDNHWVGGEAADSDMLHATVLGMSPEVHTLHRQLAYHFVGIMYYEGQYSQTLWQLAHSAPLPDNHKEEEWLTTALQYFSRGRHGAPDRNDAGALEFLRVKGLDPQVLRKQLQVLTDVVTWL
jgi:hypothetical protein